MSKDRIRQWLIAFVASLGAIIGIQKIPAKPTPTPSPTVAPTAIPTATVTATPTATATATATPDEEDELCPALPDCGSSCCHEGGENPFVDTLRAAQASVLDANPDKFNPDGSLKVSETAYTALLAAALRSRGLCARGGGIGSTSKDEVGIKTNGTRSVNVDVILGATNTPHIGGVYTCRPASF